MKMKSRRKVLCMLIVMITGLYNGTWFVNRMYYTQLCSGEYQYSTKNTYYRCGTCCTYSIKIPDYLSFVGNYSINIGDNVILIIWPDFLKTNCSYGVQISYGNEVIYAYVDAKADYVHDDSLEYSSGEERKVTEVIKKRKAIIQELLQAADAEWGCVS